MRSILFCEGHTEYKAFPAFLKRWLDPQLDHPAGIKPVRFDGWAELIKDAPVKVNLHLEGPQSADVVGVIGLLDLYGPTIYPQGVETAAQRVTWMKHHVESHVNHSKFRMLCAVHEIEAWILSDPQLLPQNVAGALPGTVCKPETVNFTTPPSKLLNKLYRDKMKRAYKKVVYGVDLFRCLDPHTAYAKCPHLVELLDEMLQMAKKAGPRRFR